MDEGLVQFIFGLGSLCLVLQANKAKSFRGTVGSMHDFGICGSEAGLLKMLMQLFAGE